MRFLITLHKKNKSEKNTKGFTLVELLVVIAILGILAAILVPSFLGYIDRHKEQQVITECRSVVLTAQSMYAKSYELGQPAPTKADIINESGLTDGSITHIELNSSSIKDSTDILLHLTYVDKGITVTYCRDYLTADDGHDDLYTLSDGLDGDGSWGTKPAPSTEVDSETETESGTETTPDDGLYMPITDDPNLKFKIDGKFEDFRDTKFDDFYANPSNKGSVAWFNLEPGQLFKLSDGSFGYVYAVDTIYDKDGNRDFTANNNQTILIVNSTAYRASDLFVKKYYNEYGYNIVAGLTLTAGTVIYDDMFGSEGYYIYTNTGGFTIPAGNDIQWLQSAMQYYSGGRDPWNKLTLYTSST